MLGPHVVTHGCPTWNYFSIKPPRSDQSGMSCPPAPRKMGNYAYAPSNDYEYVRIRVLNAPNQFASLFWNDEVKPERLSINLHKSGNCWEGHLSFVDRDGKTSCTLRKALADTNGRGSAQLMRSEDKLFTLYIFGWN